MDISKTKTKETDMAQNTKLVKLRDKETSEEHTVPVLVSQWENVMWRGEWIGWLSKNRLEIVPDAT